MLKSPLTSVLKQVKKKSFSLTASYQDVIILGGKKWMGFTTYSILEDDSVFIAYYMYFM